MEMVVRVWVEPGQRHPGVVEGNRRHLRAVRGAASRAAAHRAEKRDLNKLLRPNGSISSAMSLVSSRLSLTHLCTVERDVNQHHERVGNPAAPNWQPLATERACASSGRPPAASDVDGDTFAAVEDMRLIVPADTDVTERDRIGDVTDRGAVTLFRRADRDPLRPPPRDHLELSSSGSPADASNAAFSTGTATSSSRTSPRRPRSRQRPSTNATRLTTRRRHARAGCTPRPPRPRRTDPSEHATVDGTQPVRRGSATPSGAASTASSTRRARCMSTRIPPSGPAADRHFPAPHRADPQEAQMTASTRSARSALYLLADAAVTRPRRRRVFGGELPPDEIKARRRRRCLVVLTPAGGGLLGGYQDFGKTRVDVTCYGTTSTSRTNVYLAVQSPSFAVAAVKVGNVLLHSATGVGWQPRTKSSRPADGVRRARRHGVPGDERGPRRLVVQARHERQRRTTTRRASPSRTTRRSGTFTPAGGTAARKAFRTEPSVADRVRARRPHDRAVREDAERRDREHDGRPAGDEGHQPPAGPDGHDVRAARARRLARQRHAAGAVPGADRVRERVAVDRLLEGRRRCTRRAVRGARGRDARVRQADRSRRRSRDAAIASQPPSGRGTGAPLRPPARTSGPRRTTGGRRAI
jgi:hypothetical protein